MTTKDRLKARMAGACAALEGRKLDANNYPEDSDLHFEWLAGWTSAKLEMRQSQNTKLCNRRSENKTMNNTTDTSATEVAHERPGSGAWTLCSEKLPPFDTAVETKIDDSRGCRNICVLRRSNNLWWTQDMEMYVYYTPTHWRLLDVQGTAALLLERAAKRDADLERIALEAERDGDTQGCHLAMAARAENRRAKERIERDLEKLQNILPVPQGEERT